MNLRVKSSTRITVVMPDGCEVTWRSDGDTDTSNLLDVIARLETAADVENRRQSNG